MDFERAERRYFELKGRLDSGAISPAEFEAGVRDLTVVDAAGRTWMIGAQSGNWYYAEAGQWVAGQPPRPPVPAYASVATPVPAATKGSGSSRGVALGLAAGLLICLGVGVAAALLLPQSPFRPATGPTATATTGALQAATATPAVATPTPVPATVTPAVVTATPPPATITPYVVTATPAPATATPIVVVVTATPSVTPPPTLTRAPAPPTPTSPPPPPAAPTATPVPPSLVSPTLSNPHYELWGRPTDSTGCRSYNDGSPVRRFTIQMIVKNNTSSTIADWTGPYYTANTGQSLARCYFPYNPSDTTLPAIGPNATNNVTFVTFTDVGTWVSRVEFRYGGRTWVWTLGVDGQVLTYP